MLRFKIYVKKDNCPEFYLATMETMLALQTTLEAFKAEGYKTRVEVVEVDLPPEPTKVDFWTGKPKRSK